MSVANDYIRDRASFKGEAGLARVVMPKYVATNNAIRAVDYCMEVVGAHGMLKKVPDGALLPRRPRRRKSSLLQRPRPAN